MTDRLFQFFKYGADSQELSENWSRTSWYWLIPILLIAFWLGAHQIDAHPLWGDEIRTVMDARGESIRNPQSLVQLWENLGERNPWHAPGNYILVRALAPFVGWVPAALRVIPLLIGVLTIALTYRLGRDWLSPTVALIAAIVLMTSAFYARYLYELRVYSLLALVSAFVVWVYIRIINRPSAPSRRLLLALFVGTVLAFYSHYYATVPLVALGLYHLLFVPKNRRWWMVTGIMVAGALSFLPWVPYMLAALDKAISRDLGALDGPTMVWFFFYMFSNGVVVLTLVLIAAAFAGLRQTRNRRNIGQLLFIALSALVVLLVFHLGAKIIRFGTARYMMPLWPLFALVIAVGISQFQRWPRLMTIVIILCAGTGLYATLVANLTHGLDGSKALFPIQHVAAVLEQDRAQNGDMVVHYLPDWNRVTDNFTYTGIAGLYYKPMHVGAVMAMGWTRPRNEESLVRKLKTYGRVWIAYLPDDRPQSLDVLIADLSGMFSYCGRLTERADVTIELYARTDIPCPDNEGLYLDGRRAH